MQGWISLHRKVFESELWNDVTTFRLFVYLLIHASHQDGIKIGGIELKRGQWIRSTRKLAEDLSYKEGRGLKKYSTKTINKCIHKLVNAERVSIQETEVGTLFTITNYALYQDVSTQKEETGNGTGNEGETKGKRTGNNNNNANNANNANKDKKTSSRKRVYDKESVEYQLALRLFKRIKENDPNHKQPNLQHWANDVRLMIERDNREAKQISYLIDWTQQDSFWKSNILSISKLRKQFDQLKLKAIAEHQNKKDITKQKKLISIEKPEHVEDPILPDDVDEQIEKMLETLS